MLTWMRPSAQFGFCRFNMKPQPLNPIVVNMKNKRGKLSVVAVCLPQLPSCPHLKIWACQSG